MVEMIAIGIGAALAAIIAAFGLGQRSGEKKANGKASEKQIKQEKSGRDALRDGRDSGLSPDDRLRRNDGNWRGM